jgi:hypothetical protein
LIAESRAIAREIAIKVAEARTALAEAERAGDQAMVAVALAELRQAEQASSSYLAPEIYARPAATDLTSLAPLLGRHRPGVTRSRSD